MLWNIVMQKTGKCICSCASQGTSDDILSVKTFRKQWICHILFAKIFASRRGVLWLQACYFYFDKVLLFKQEKLIANIFFRPLLGFLSSFGAIF